MTAIAAVFIALALGILIGVSFGDSFLVSNQRDVIRLMEEQLGQFRENNRSQEIELQRWETLAPRIRRCFHGALGGKNIFIIAPPDRPDRELRALLEEAGAAVAVIRIAADLGEPVEGGQLSGEIGALARLLAAPVRTEPGWAAGKGLFRPEEGALDLPGPPDCCLLLLEGAGNLSGNLFRELRSNLQDNGLRVIVLLPWPGGDPPPLPAAERGFNLVDNIDTFWGRLALLMMIAGDIDGYYGFGKGSAGLIPGAADEG